MTSARPTPEHIVRNRTPIPPRPSDDDIRGIVGEIARQRELDPELEIVLQHMVNAVFARFNDIWDALEILDKRYQEFEDDDVVDTEFVEERRETQNRNRTVTDRDGDIEIDLVDIITKVIYMKGNRGGRLKLTWQEPFPG